MRSLLHLPDFDMKVATEYVNRHLWLSSSQVQEVVASWIGPVIYISSTFALDHSRLPVMKKPSHVSMGPNRPLKAK